MSEPFVQFFFDPAKQAVMRNSAKYAMQPRLAPAELFWTVACDSANKVVVRKLWNAAPFVIGTARLEHGALVETAQNETIDWTAIGQAVIGERATAAAIPDAQRDAFDDGAVGAVPAQQSKRQRGDPLWMRAGVWIVLALLVAGAVVVSTLWDRFAGKYDTSTYANGAKCTRDSQCASRNCQGTVCKPSKSTVNGERCDRDAECASGRCSSHVCN